MAVPAVCDLTGIRIDVGAIYLPVYCQIRGPDKDCPVQYVLDGAVPFLAFIASADYNDCIFAMFYIFPITIPLAIFFFPGIYAVLAATILEARFKMHMKVEDTEKANP